MNNFINVGGANISLQLKLHAIRIFNDDSLSLMLANNAEAKTTELITLIKSEYFKLFNTDFQVSDNSIAIEIWAHVYAEKFAEAVKKFSSINFFDRIAEKILYHAEVIDIGEKGHDENRFVWDSLENFKPAIAKILF